jgi:hypothetical protein
VAIGNRSPLQTHPSPYQARFSSRSLDPATRDKHFATLRLVYRSFSSIPSGPTSDHTKSRTYSPTFRMVGWPSGIEPELSVPQTEVITVIPWPPWYQWCDKNFFVAHLTRLLYHIGVLLTSMVIGLSLSSNRPFHNLRYDQDKDQYEDIIKDCSFKTNRN